MRATTIVDEGKVAIEYLEDLQTTFIRNVQHELRTPVSIIMGYAELLHSGALGTLDPEQRQAVNTITDQALVLRRLVERITTLLSIETGEMARQPVTVTDIVTNVVEMQRSKATQAGLTLTAYLASDLPLICGDPGYLQQAVECLVENALKFTPNGGQIEVQAETKGGWVYLSVSDTGIGIAEDKLGHVFNTFYQIDGSITRDYDGLGLGLAVAKAVIEAHEGQIEADSQLGQGSRFTIKLPALAALTQMEPLVEAGPKPRRILIVDDEAYVAMTLQEGLEKLPNCEIVAATSGQEALQRFKQQPFDLLITDYQMPDIDGITLTTKVRQLYPQTGTILITAYGDRIPRERVRGISILDKPVKLSEIRNATLETLENLICSQGNNHRQRRADKYCQTATY